MGDIFHDDLDCLQGQDSVECVGLEYYEKSSLNEIRRMLEDDLYLNDHTVREHMEYLENVTARLQAALSEAHGANCDCIKRDIFDVKKLHDALMVRLNNFSS